MITSYRIASVAPGKTASAIGFAHEIAGYMKSTYGTEPEVMMPIGGNPMCIGWATRYKDLAAVAGKLPADVKYWEIVGKATDYFIAGSIQDSIWRTL